MTVNAVSFDDFDNQSQIEAHQAGLLRVILEGKSDVSFFKDHWFIDLRDTFDFVEPAEIGGRGTGCTAVVPAVCKSRDEDGIPALGIVDRDWLFRSANWGVLFSIDDAHFAREARNDEVYVTALWELEAYLLEPDLLSIWVALSSKRQPAKEVDRLAALTKACRECEIILGAASIFAGYHADEEPCASNFFAGQTAEDVSAYAQKKYANASEIYRAAADQVDLLVRNVLANAPPNDSERLVFFLRYVDTKRLLLRLAQSLQVHKDSHYGLALFMKETARRPSELQAVLDDFARREAA